MLYADKGEIHGIDEGEDVEEGDDVDEGDEVNECDSAPTMVLVPQDHRLPCQIIETSQDYKDWAELVGVPVPCHIQMTGNSIIDEEGTYNGNLIPNYRGYGYNLALGAQPPMTRTPNAFDGNVLLFGGHDDNGNIEALTNEQITILKAQSDFNGGNTTTKSHSLFCLAAKTSTFLVTVPAAVLSPSRHPFLQRVNYQVSSEQEPNESDRFLHVWFKMMQSPSKIFIQGIKTYISSCANSTGQQLNGVNGEDGYSSFPTIMFYTYGAELYALLNAADAKGFATDGHIHKATGLFWKYPSSNIASTGWSVAFSSNPDNYFVAVAKDSNLGACIQAVQVYLLKLPCDILLEYALTQRVSYCIGKLITLRVHSTRDQRTL
jgi:hypothetical protein